ncbi:SDR family oxidoreductase [Actinoallomurus bryophytorum]|uniref:NAD(P)-dependent dehydrogenase (Short-subunit alcohol dehydrogenase family) n=1 Tax=Actinoallomurus bryophytorum TaxID=1490222 RepID=A0A543CHZ9_9ACTN|nr:glucose 1-dehydrogenase [Actinoallomurus bryophytorum]TQL96729.1 NAD(P)-dependent dehydrogenase (short-subunit alcohol dehydrogenase family) [Actinoallomurus bryophytorum]
MTSPVVLITGALTGVGRATAVAFAKEGAKVVVSGRRQEAGESLAAELKSLGTEAEFVRADVRYEEELKNLVDRTVERFGRVDVAVNNAGTEGELKPIVEVTKEDFDLAFETNVLGTLMGIKYQLRAMAAQGSGSIINVSSIYGLMGAPIGPLYVASKHAVVGLTRSAALEAARAGVRVNAVTLGAIETAMHDRVMGSEENKAAFAATIPQGRPGTPEEAADLIVFLGSGRSGYITGQTITIDGGKMAGN